MSLSLLFALLYILLLFTLPCSRRLAHMLSAWIWSPEGPGRRTEGGRKEEGEGKMHISPASYLQGCHGVP